MMVQCRWETAFADPGVVQLAELSDRFGDRVHVVYDRSCRRGGTQAG
jgi:hypothetical protein